MADIDDKQQKQIDKATKAAKKEVMTAVTTAIKEATDTAGGLDDKGQAKAVKTALKDLKAAIKDATAE